MNKLFASTDAFSGQTITRILPVTGGCIHNCWRVELNNEINVFAKTTDSDSFPMLSFEAEGLQALNHYADQNHIIIPLPIELKKVKKLSLLLLPWIDLENGNEFSLGIGLAKLHQSSAQENKNYYGWESDGFIGLGQQAKGFSANWGEFFTNYRLKPQLIIAKNWGLEIRNLEEYLSKISTYIVKHNPKACLVHGDLWKGNAAISSTNKGVIFDPAIYWADREVDLAMTKLFGGFSQDFYEGYESIWPLSKTYKNRVDIYNLYHILNHANMFGGGYKSQSLSLIKKIKFILDL